VPRVATVQAKPLAERLLTGFRYLLDHGLLPLNRPGAAGFCVGEDLWLVSKRALDALREHLLSEGQPGIPARNERLMDELQQHGLLIPNGDRAVWTAEVRLGEWCQRLTLLRFPLGRMWPDQQGRPQSAAGSVLPLTGERRSEGTASPPGLDGPDTNFGWAGEGEDLAEVQPQGSGEGTGGFLSDAPRRGPSVETVCTEQKEPLQRNEDESRSPDEFLADNEEDDVAECFLRWLREGIEGRTLAINTPNARLHVLPEGLALVSPGLFRDFDPNRWQHVQKRFQRLKHHRKRPDGTNIWNCQVAKNRKKSVIRVFLLPEPKVILGVSLPPPNPVVSLLREEDAASG